MDPKEQFVLIIQDLLSPTKVEEGTIQLKKFIEENEKNLLEIFMETIASQQIHEDVRTYAATLLVSNSSTLLASNNAPNLRLIGEQSLMFLYNAIYPNKIALKLCSWIERIYGRIINLKNKSKNKTNRQFHWNELKEKITKELERIVQGAEVMIPVNDFNKYSYLVSLEMLIILISKDGEYLNQQETNRFMKIILHFVQLNEANQLELLFTNSSCKALAILLLRLAPYHKNQETDEMIEVSIKLALNSLARYLSIDKINRTTDMKFDGIFDYFDSFLEDGKNLFHFLQQILIHLCQLIDNVAIVCDSHLRERSLQFLTDTVHNCLPQLATNPQLLSSIIQSSFHIMSCPWSMAEADKYLQEPKSISVMSDMNESIGIRMSARMLLDAIVENLTPKLFFDNFIPLLNKASGNFLQLTFEKEDDPNETFSFLKKVKENEKFPEHIEMLQRLPSETHTALLLSMATTCRCGGELIRKYFYSQFVRFGLLSTIIDNPLIQSASFILLGEILDNVYQESYFVEMTSVCLPMICRHITNQMGSIETGMMGDHIDEDNDEETMKKHDVIWKSFYLFNILMTNLKGIPSILIDNSIELLCQFIRHPTGEIKHKIFAFNSIETIFFNSTSMNLINIDHVERLLSTITPIMYVPLTEFTEVDIDIDAEKYSKHLLQMKSYDVFYAIIENWKSRLYLNEICSDEKLKKNYGYLSGKNLQEIIVYTFQLLEKIDQLRDNGEKEENNKIEIVSTENYSDLRGSIYTFLSSALSSVGTFCPHPMYFTLLHYIVRSLTTNEDMGMDESMLEKLENQMIKGDESIDESVNEDDDESEIDDDSDDELEGGDILNSTIDLKSSCMRSLNILFSSITASLFRNDVQMQPAISLFNNDVLPFKLNDFTLARLNITIKIPREWSNENDEKSNLFHLYTKALFIQKLMLTLHDFLDYPVDDVISTSLTSLTSIATSIDYHLSLIIIKYVDDDRRLFRDIKFSNFSLIKLIEFLRFDGKTEERSLENKLVNSVKLYNSLSELSKKNDEKMDENGDDVDDIDDVDDEKRFISIDGFVHRLLDIIDESDMENDMLEDEKKLFGEQMMDDDVYSETLRAIINVMDEVSNIHQIHEFDMLEKKTKLLSFYNKNKFQLFNEKGSTLIITHNTLVKLVDYCEKIIQKKSSSSQKTAKNSKIIQSTLELFPSIIDYLYYATLSPHFHRHEFYGKMEELKPLQNYHELQQKNKKLTNSQRKKNRIQNTQNVRKKNKSSINNNRPQPHQIQPKDEFDSWNDLRRVLLFRIYDIVLTHFEKQFIPTTKTTKLSTKPIENTDEDLSHTLGYLSMLINCTLIQDLAPNDGSVSKPNVLSFYVTQQKNFLSYFHLIYSRLFHLVQSLVEISKFTSYSDEIRNNFIYAISTLFSASPFHYLSILSLEGKESSFHSFMELCINELKGNSSIIEMKMNDFDILYHDTLVASLSRIFLALHELKMNGINSFNFTDFKNVKLEEQTKIQNFFKSSSYQQLISNDTFNQLISITWEHLRILDDVSEIQTCLSFIQCVLANYTNCLNLEACKKFLNGTLVRFVEEEGTIPVKRLGETDSPSSKLMKLRCSTTLKKVRAQLNVGNE